MICAIVLSLLQTALPDVVTLTAVLEEDGVPVDRAVSASFSLWDATAAGASVWHDAARAIVVNDGVLVVDIGADEPLPQRVFTRALWLEIVVDGQVLAPRVRVGSAAHALEATHADECASLDGVDDVAALVALATTPRVPIRLQPRGCGGRLVLDAECTTTPCAQYFKTCDGECLAPEQQTCTNAEVGWLFAP